MKDQTDVLLTLVGRLNKSPARVDEHYPDVLRTIADLREDLTAGQVTSIPRGTGLKEREPATPAPSTLLDQIGHERMGRLRIWANAHAMMRDEGSLPSDVHEVLRILAEYPGHPHDPDNCDDCYSVVEEAMRGD